MPSVLQLTDLHVFADPAARLKGIPTRELLLDVLRHVRESGQSFEHVVTTGDHTHDELPDTYADVSELLSDWRDCLHVVPGNHDDRAVMRSVLSGIVPPDGPLTFSFTVGDWQLIGLDSHCPGAVHGEISPAQIPWLATQLQESAPRAVGLFLHHPPVSVDSVWMDAIALQNPEPLLELIESEPRIRFVSCGHVHHEFQSRIGSAWFFTSPSTGIQFNPDSDTPAFAAAPPGYRVFEFNGDDFETRVVRLDETRFSPSVEVG